MHSKPTWGAALVGCLTLLMGGLVAPAAHAAEARDLLWARSAGGVGWESGDGIAVDAAGNALVTGHFYHSATFGAGEANETTLTYGGLRAACKRCRRAALHGYQKRWCEKKCLVQSSGKSFCIFGYRYHPQIFASMRVRSPGVTGSVSRLPNDFRVMVASDGDAT